MDARFGFNSVSNQTATTFPANFQAERITLTQPSGKSTPSSFEEITRPLPTGKAPTVTGFASPTLFRLGLLRLGYHWKDPGAGTIHGDITHRLQWFAITSAMTKIGIGVPPLHLFEKPGSPETWNPNFHAGDGRGEAGRALWDLLCDCFVPDLQKDAVGPTCSDASYRSPVNLQRDLTEKESPYKTRLPLLRRIISRKKVTMRERDQALGGRPTVAVLDHEGDQKTTEMIGKVAFFFPKNN